MDTHNGANCQTSDPAERLMFGSDWPVLNLAGSYPRWVETVERSCVCYRSRSSRGYGEKQRLKRTGWQPIRSKTVTKTKKPLAVIAVFGNLVVLAHSRSQTKWVGMVIGIKSDK